MYSREDSFQNKSAFYRIRTGASGRDGSADTAQHRERFDVRGVREEVEGFEVGKSVAAVEDAAEVARERGDVARDVDDAAGAQRNRGGERFARHAGARRV